MTKKVNQDPDYVLWNLLILTRDAVYRAREKELAQYGITPEQAGTLFAIYSLGDQATVSKIGLRIMRKPHSVSSLLKRLRKYGLVTKQESGNRREPAIYRLTQEGHEAYECSTKRESLHKALSALSGTEKSNLEDSLRRLMDQAFKDMADDLKPPWP